mmetsp:Transcript_29933/g.85802  ORF Transcript_29933/g.85802 Transcript_29933/m.85802 type:complete len:230 (-) Transcript_29933:553-1242(-)
MRPPGAVARTASAAARFRCFVFRRVRRRPRVPLAQRGATRPEACTAGAVGAATAAGAAAVAASAAGAKVVAASATGAAVAAASAAGAAVVAASAAGAAVVAASAVAAGAALAGGALETTGTGAGTTAALGAGEMAVAVTVRGGSWSRKPDSRFLAGTPGTRRFAARADLGERGTKAFFTGRLGSHALHAELLGEQPCGSRTFSGTRSRFARASIAARARFLGERGDAGE